MLHSDMDVSRNSAMQGVMSTIPVASPIIVTSQDATLDEESCCKAPSTPGAGSLHSVASIATVISSDKSVIKQEKWWSTTLQVAVPFFLAGIGTIGAGLTLGIVQVSSLLSVFYLTTNLLLFPCRMGGVREYDKQNNRKRRPIVVSQKSDSVFRGIKCSDGQIHT